MVQREGPSLGYDALPTERRNPRSMALDRMSTRQILRLINDEDRRVPRAVAAQISRIAQAVEAVVRAIRSGGRVIYVGAGTSGRIGLLDALEWPPTFGVRPDLVRVVVAGGARAAIQAASPSEDDARAGRAALARAGAGRRDVVIALAASGMTPFVLGAVDEARRRGCAVVGISNVPGSALAHAADVAITPDVGPEVLTGSTRMKAGTSQKLVLNMISTAAMVRLGKVYSNLMVEMPPRNRKLTARAHRMVGWAAGLDPEQSRQALEAAGGSIKVAIVMARAGVGRTAAVRLLARAQGHVRAALRLAGRRGGRGGGGGDARRR